MGAPVARALAITLVLLACVRQAALHRQPDPPPHPEAPLFFDTFQPADALVYSLSATTYGDDHLLVTGSPNAPPDQPGILVRLHRGHPVWSREWPLSSIPNCPFCPKGQPQAVSVSPTTHHAWVTCEPASISVFDLLDNSTSSPPLWTREVLHAPAGDTPPRLAALLPTLDGSMLGLVATDPASQSLNPLNDATLYRFDRWGNVTGRLILEAYLSPLKVPQAWAVHPTSGNLYLLLSMEDTDILTDHPTDVIETDSIIRQIHTNPRHPIKSGWLVERHCDLPQNTEGHSYSFSHGVNCGQAITVATSGGSEVAYVAGSGTSLAGHFTISVSALRGEDGFELGREDWSSGQDDRVRGVIVVGGEVQVVGETESVPVFQPTSMDCHQWWQLSLDPRNLSPLRDPRLFDLQRTSLEGNRRLTNNVVVQGARDASWLLAQTVLDLREDEMMCGRNLTALEDRPFVQLIGMPGVPHYNPHSACPIGVSVSCPRRHTASQLRLILAVGISLACGGVSFLFSQPWVTGEEFRGLRAAATPLRRTAGITGGGEKSPLLVNASTRGASIVEMRLWNRVNMIWCGTLLLTGLGVVWWGYARNEWIGAVCLIITFPAVVAALLGIAVSLVNDVFKRSLLPHYYRITWYLCLFFVGCVAFMVPIALNECQLDGDCVQAYWWSMGLAVYITLYCQTASMILFAFQRSIFHGEEEKKPCWRFHLVRTVPLLLVLPWAFMYLFTWYIEYASWKSETLQ